MLDLANSTRELFSSNVGTVGGDGPARLVLAVAALSEAFWRQGAETLAFTGDGLLAFLEDAGRPSHASWALFDALRDSARVLAMQCGQWDKRIGLRGGVDHGDILQVADGPFAGHLLGRSVFRMEEVTECARRADTRPGLFASIVVTEQAVDYCRLPVSPAPVVPPPGCLVLSQRDVLHVMDEPPLQSIQAAAGDSPNRHLRVRRRGIILYLGLRARPRGPAFPGLAEYLDTLRDLVGLLCLCGAEVISITPTGAFGLVSERGCLPQQAGWVADVLSGRTPTELSGSRLVLDARARGWVGVRLVAGAVWGDLDQPLTGPLAGQSVGAAIVYARRCARVAEIRGAASRRDVCLVVPRPGSPGRGQDLWASFTAVRTRRPWRAENAGLSGVKNLSQVGFERAHVLWLPADPG